MSDPTALEILRLKRGALANLGDTETLLLARQGEPAYTTDTKSFYIHDGSDYLVPTMPIVTVTASSVTLDGQDTYILCDASSNNITVNLPAISGNAGRVFHIKKIDSSTNTVTIDGNGSETIDGATTYTLNNQYTAVSVVAGASEWSLIKHFFIDTYERHHQLRADLTGTPANQPNEVDFGTVAGLQFASTGTEYVFCEWEIPDDWDGGDIYFEVDWFPDSGAMSGTDTIKWDVEYRSIVEGESILTGTSVTVSTTDSTDYAQYVQKHARHTLAYNNANQPLTAQDHIYFKISRDTAVANDFAGTVTVTAFEIVYNSIGLSTN